MVQEIERRESELELIFSPWVKCLVQREIAFKVRWSLDVRINGWAVRTNRWRRKACRIEMVLASRIAGQRRYQDLRIGSQYALIADARSKRCIEGTVGAGLDRRTTL